MENYVIIRTISNLSYSGGEICKEKIGVKTGLLLRPSAKSLLKIWFPMEEIVSVIYPDGRMVEGGGELKGLIRSGV